MQHVAPRPTIVDVAGAAGVSVPTVSRVLNGSTPVSEDRRERVLAAVKELGYRPNAAARALVRGEKRIVSVVTTDPTVYGNSQTLGGIEEAARRSGLVVVITIVDSTDSEDIARTNDLALAQPIAGVIVLDFDPIAGMALEMLPNTVPVFAAGIAHADRVPAVYLDVFTASANATRYLLGLGHATVHFAGGFGDRTSDLTSKGRVAGWRHALEEAGAPIPEIVRCDFTPIGGLQAGRHLVETGDVEAVLCGSDEIAMGVMSAFADAGVHVPDDVSVIGFDDLPIGRIWRPALTTVRLDFRSLGRSVFGLLEASLGNVERDDPLDVPELIVRDSTGPRKARVL